MKEKRDKKKQVRPRNKLRQECLDYRKFNNRLNSDPAYRKRFLAGLDV